MEDDYDEYDYGAKDVRAPPLGPQTSFKSTLAAGLKGVGNVVSIFNPSIGRLFTAGLNPGGVSSSPKGQPAVAFKQSNAQGQSVPIEQDWRVRVSLAPDAKILYNDANNGILEPLIETQGVIFPYTPQITTTYLSNYSPQKLTHSNYASYFYDGSEVSAITLSGDFTVQNQNEGRYLMAAIQFFRAASKMFFGKSALAGQPPPILFLDGYGSHYFPHVTCVLTSFTHTMDGNVDYIDVPLGSGNTRLPTTSTIQLSLQPVYSRTNISKNFTLEDFARGNLIKGNGGFM